MLRLSVAVFAITIGVSVAAAQNHDIIKARQSAFKAMSDAAKPTIAMMKGERPYEQAAVDKALATMAEKAAVLRDMFPDDSKTGEKTEALPAIWENKEEFVGRFDKLAEAAKAGQASITDEFVFMDQWPKVMGNCSGCHKKYRKDD